MANRISLKTTAYKRGRQLVDERILAVREDDGPWRTPQDDNLHAALRWLQAQDFTPERVALPAHSGTITLIRSFSQGTA